MPARRSLSDQKRPGTSSGEGRLPTFLIIGASKAGTTSLASYLSQHPDVFMSSRKEINFFDLHYGEGVDWYRAHFVGAGDRRAVGEATPTYFLDDRALSRMAELLPDARLVVLLRNPVDAAWSNYWMQRSLGFEKRDFAEAVRAELEGERSGAIQYLWPVRYVRRLERVCDLYPREALLVRLFDDLTADPRATFTEVCRHIGVDDTVVPPNVGDVYNPSTRLRSERLRYLMLRSRAWKWMPRLATPIDRWNRVRTAYPEIDPVVRGRITDLLAEDTAALTRWLGRDLSVWRM